MRNKQLKSRLRSSCKKKTWQKQEVHTLCEPPSAPTNYQPNNVVWLLTLLSHPALDEKDEFVVRDSSIHLGQSCLELLWRQILFFEFPLLPELFLVLVLFSSNGVASLMVGHHFLGPVNATDDGFLDGSK